MSKDLFEFRVWSELSGVRKVQCSSGREAAEDHAERIWTPESGEHIDIYVQRVGEEKVFLYCVDVDFDVSFSAMKIGPAAPEATPDETEVGA